MTSRELLRRLMEQQGLNPYSLSRRLDGKTKQPQLHRFLSNDALEPRRATLAPVAEYFGIPLEALFDDEVATATAARLGLLEQAIGLLNTSHLPLPLPAQKLPLDQALTVVLEAIASAPDKARLRTALMALLDDDAPAYRQRVAELLNPPLAESGKRKA